MLIVTRQQRRHTCDLILGERSNKLFTLLDRKRCKICLKLGIRKAHNDGRRVREHLANAASVSRTVRYPRMRFGRIIITNRTLNDMGIQVAGRYAAQGVRFGIRISAINTFIIVIICALGMIAFPIIVIFIVSISAIRADYLVRRFADILIAVGRMRFIEGITTVGAVHPMSVVAVSVVLG